jgi:uncharacterized membrane protein
MTGEVTQPKSSKNMHAIILTILGLVSLIAGVAIITVRGNPLRGSGAGTILSVIGIAIMVIAFLRFAYKRS